MDNTTKSSIDYDSENGFAFPQNAELKNPVFQVKIVSEEIPPLADIFKSIGGNKQFMFTIPPDKSFDGEMTIEFDEFQDNLIALRMLQAWQNLISEQSINEDGDDVTGIGLQFTDGIISFDKRTINSGEQNEQCN